MYGKLEMYTGFDFSLDVPAHGIEDTNELIVKITGNDWDTIARKCREFLGGVKVFGNNKHADEYREWIKETLMALPQSRIIGHSGNRVLTFVICGSPEYDLEI